MGVYFIEKSLSFLSPILCVVFKILKLQHFSQKLGYFQNKPKMAYSRDLSKVAIMNYQGLSWSIKDCQGLSRTVMEKYKNKR